VRPDPSNQGWAKGDETCRGRATHTCITSLWNVSYHRRELPLGVPRDLGLSPLRRTQPPAAYLYTTTTKRRNVKNENDPELLRIAGMVPARLGWPLMIRQYPLVPILGTVDAHPVIYSKSLGIPLLIVPCISPPHSLLGSTSSSRLA